MPRKCSLCTHKDSAEITKLISAGGSKGSVSVRYGVSETAVHRHRVNCLRIGGTPNAPRKPRQSLAPTPAAGESAVRIMEPIADVATRDGRMAVASHLLNEALELLQGSKVSGDTKTRLAAFSKSVESLQLVMRAHGDLQADTTVNIDNRKLWIDRLDDKSFDQLDALERALDHATENSTFSPDSTPALEAGERP